jgi:hypothetical protein
MIYSNLTDTSTNSRPHALIFSGPGSTIFSKKKSVGPFTTCIGRMRETGEEPT